MGPLGPGSESSTLTPTPALPTATRTLSPTPTLAPPTLTFTLSLTPVPPTLTYTPSLTPVPPTFTYTPTLPGPTATYTDSPTAVPTNTFTLTPTPIPTNTFTDTYTLTPVPPTNTFSSTLSFTNTYTFTQTYTPSNTFTRTQTPVSGGLLSTYAGDATGPATTLDGIGTAALFKKPWGLTWDGGNYLYVSEETDNVIRRIDLTTAAVSTVAGLAGAPGTVVDGAGSAARFKKPHGLAYQAGYLYIVDAATDIGGGGRLRRMDPGTFAVTTLASFPAFFSTYEDVVYDGVGAFLVTGVPGRIWKVTQGTWAVSDYLGTGLNACATTGTGLTAQIDYPHDMVFDPTYSYMYFSDFNKWNIRQTVYSSASVSIVSAICAAGGACTPGLGNLARYQRPAGVDRDTSGQNLFIVEFENHTLRQLDLGSRYSWVIAGICATPGNVDGTLGVSQFNGPRNVVYVPGNQVYITDQNNRTVRRYAW